MTRFRSGTARKQTRLEVLIEGWSISASDVLVNAEIVDEGTGGTFVLLRSAAPYEVSGRSTAIPQ